MSDLTGTGPTLEALTAGVARLTTSVDAMTAEISGLKASLATTQEFGETTRKLVQRQLWQRRALIVLGIIVAGVAVLAFRNASAAKDAAQTAQRAVNSQVATCVAGNQYRADDLTRWQTLIANFQPTPPVGETPAQAVARMQRIQQFEAFIVKQDAPRDCRKIVPK